MPKPRIVSNKITIPDEVEVTVKSRLVTVKGPRGTLTKDFTHIDVDMYLAQEESDAGSKQVLKVNAKTNPSKQNKILPQFFCTTCSRR